MDTVKLEYFIRVCECGNLTKAAQSLFISQPALSQAISALERELNCELFHRDKKRLIITKQGQACLKYARQITEAVKTLQEAVTSGSDAHLLRIMSIDSYFYTYLVSQFMFANPNFSFSVEYSDADVKKILRSNLVDVCITDHPIETDDLVCHAIFNERTYVVVPPKSPLYGKKTAYLSDFDGCAFLRSASAEKNSDMEMSFRNISLLNACLTANHIHLDFNYMDDHYLKHLWNRTDSYMFTSRFGMLTEKRTVPEDLNRLVRLEDEILNFHYHLVYKKESTPATQQFVNWLLEHNEYLISQID